MAETVEPVAARIDRQRPTEELAETARAEEVDLVGESRMLTGLTEAVLETAPEVGRRRIQGRAYRDACRAPSRRSGSCFGSPWRGITGCRYQGIVCARVVGPPDGHAVEGRIVARRAAATAAAA